MVLRLAPDRAAWLNLGIVFSGSRRPMQRFLPYLDRLGSAALPLSRAQVFVTAVALYYGVAWLIVIGIGAWLSTGTLVIGGNGPGNGLRWSSARQSMASV